MVELAEQELEPARPKKWPSPPLRSPPHSAHSSLFTPHFGALSHNWRTLEGRAGEVPQEREWEQQWQ